MNNRNKGCPYFNALTILINATVNPSAAKSIVKRGKLAPRRRSIATPPHTAAPIMTAISIPSDEYLTQSFIQTTRPLCVGLFVLLAHLVEHTARA